MVQKLSPTSSKTHLTSYPAVRTGQPIRDRNRGLDVSHLDAGHTKEDFTGPVVDELLGHEPVVEVTLE